MTRDEFEAMLQALAQGWAEKAYEKVASYYAEDLRYIDPLRYRFSSRTELLSFFSKEEAEESTVWHNILFDEERQLGAAEYTYEGKHRYHGTVLVKLRDGKITHWREYQHTSELEWEDFWAGAAFSSAQSDATD
ncbi:MAG TPA: nuclear transport factor 2 family protein [Thermoanaerobaculia bacterium]|nr:nuclear transport factor 2 family protein [Thermoanaerobaculia bacterium]